MAWKRTLVDAMFSNIVPVNRTGSCATRPIFDPSRDVQRPRIDAVDDDGAARDLVEAQEQLHDGRLASNRGAASAHVPPGCRGRARRRRAGPAARVAELDVDELDGPGAPRRRDGRRRRRRPSRVRGAGDGIGVGLVDG